MLNRHCADARYVWNLALEQANCYRPERGPTPNNAERMHQLAELRKDSWLGEGSSVVQQQALRDFDQALQNWWKGTHRRPTWRKKGQNEGFRVLPVSVHKLSRKWSEVLIPKIGYVRFKVSREVPEAKSIRVTMDRSGRWHVSFTAPQPIMAREQTGAIVGLDMGVAHTVTSSDGEHFHSPILRPTEAQRLRRLQRKMARQVKGSNRRARTRLAIAKVKAREADRRKDFTEQTTTNLVRDFDLIAIEDLAVSNMLRSAKGTVEQPGRNVAAKRGLNRSISAQGWSQFRTRLEQKAATCEVLVVAVNPAYTSQRCAVCGHVAAENRKSQAVFCCRSCGYEAHADVNAACNILAAGLAVSARGGTPCSKRPVEARTAQMVAA
jgi:IS605 OrfB family transposase